MNPFDVDRIEDQLRKTLARREPPRGFASRVAARTRKSPAGGAWRWALAASMALVFTAVFSVHRVEEYRKGQQAKRQLMLALEITSEKLAAAQQTIEEAVRLDTVLKN